MKLDCVGFIYFLKMLKFAYSLSLIEYEYKCVIKIVHRKTFIILTLYSEITER